MATTDKKPETATPVAVPAKKQEFMVWAKFYSAHSPVMYSEMVERWGGEQQLWDAYAAGKMEFAEAEYFQGPRIFSAAQAFARVVLPALHAMDERIRAVEELIGAVDPKSEPAPAAPPMLPSGIPSDRSGSGGGSGSGSGRGRL